MSLGADDSGDLGWYAVLTCTEWQIFGVITIPWSLRPSSPRLLDFQEDGNNQQYRRDNLRPPMCVCVCVFFVGYRVAHRNVAAILYLCIHNIRHTLKTWSVDNYSSVRVTGNKVQRKMKGNPHSVVQACTNPRYEVTVEATFCTVASNICVSSVWILDYIIFLVPKILRWLLHLWKNCAPLQ
jgi:hypothetical protein